MSLRRTKSTIISRAGLFGRQNLQIIDTKTQKLFVTLTLDLNLCHGRHDVSLHEDIVISKLIFTCIWKVDEKVMIGTFRIIQSTASPRHQMNQLMRLWCLSHGRPAKAQTSLCIHAVLPEPSLFAHMKYGSRRSV